MSDHDPFYGIHFNVVDKNVDDLANAEARPRARRGLLPICDRMPLAGSDNIAQLIRQLGSARSVLKTRVVGSTSMQ
jgi:hypothetical protein